MRRIGLVMTFALLFSLLASAGCDAIERFTIGQTSIGAPSIIIAPATTSNTIGESCELTAVVMKGGGQLSGVEVRFEFAPGSIHHPSNLTADEAFDIETCVWPPEGALISEHWKKEKVYRTTNNYVYCSTGPEGQAMLRYTGIKDGNDVVFASATIDGKIVKAQANAEWKPVPTGTYRFAILPQTATNVVGTAHTVTFVVKKGTQPVANIEVRFQVSGANPLGEVSKLTDGEGKAIFSYTGTNIGSDTISATPVIPDAPMKPPTGQVTKTWTSLPLSVLNISLEPPTASIVVGQEYALLATVTQDGKPVSGAEVCFEIIAGSAHCPANLTSSESYEVEYGQPEKQAAKISEHWKKEKVYRNSNNWVYCGTTSASGKAKLTLGGIKVGLDNVLVTSTAEGSYAEAPAAINWTTPVTPIRITVVSPNGGESWQEGSTQAITWTSSGIIGNVGVELSRDGGETWTTIMPATANDGNEAWLVTGPMSYLARVRVSSASVSDTSDVNFTILGSETGIPPLQGPFHEEFFSWAGMPEPTFIGAPILVRDGRSINYDWGEMAPTWGVGTDYFLARWTGLVDFAAGTYTFRARADDGIRLWVDGNLLIDEWRPQVVTEFTVTRSLIAGQHEIKVEYFERMGLAICQVNWEKQP